MSLSRSVARSIPPLVTSVLLVGCGGPAASPAARTDGDGDAAPAKWEPFREATTVAGLDFVHHNGAIGRQWFVENLGAGAGLLDCDGDGDLDLVLRQGAPLDPATPAAEARPTNRLFRNDLGSGVAGVRFVDVTAGSGLEVAAYGMGIATGDYDGDGHIDLYLTNFGAARLLRGIGGCRFEDKTAAAGAADSSWTTAATFFDAEGDGDLDLYVGRYVDYVVGADPRCTRGDSGPDYCGPRTFPAVPDRLLQNRGDGSFADVTSAAGLLAVEPGRALGAAALDVDRDGRLDLFVANDSTENHLWRNLGGGVFAEEALARGVAFNATGLRTGDMGVVAADLDGDADLDLASTHFDFEGMGYWRNLGDGYFAESAAPAGLLGPTLADTGFGVAAVDLEGDGWLDLYVANGAVRFIERLVLEGHPFPLHQRNRLLRNLGDGRFEEVTESAGAALLPSEVSRGLASGDVDNDGDLDLVVTNNGGPARLLLGRASERGPWLGLRLLTADGRRDALTAEATVRCAAGRALTRRAATDGSYLSASDPRVSFGLSGCNAIEDVVVSWPGGEKERFAPPPLRRYTSLVQGSGEPATDAARLERSP